MEKEFHYLALTAEELETLLFCILTEAGKMIVETVKAGNDRKKQAAIRKKVDLLAELREKISDEIFVKRQ
jgi:hypothetical protein